MKVFIDTNVLIAAFATHGACDDLLNHCIARHTIYTSDFVLNELEDKLLRKIKLARDEVDRILFFMRRNCIIAQEGNLFLRRCRDHDDDHILAAAINERVNCIITGDKDLLVLKKFGDVLIVSPSDFWKLELMQNVLRPDDN